MDNPRRTYKLFIGGVFPRSDSGETAPVVDAKGKVVASVSMASSKDVRDAVDAAHAAAAEWAATSAYERGRALHRIARAMDAHRSAFEDGVARSEAVSPRRAATQVDQAIERWASYAGWCTLADSSIGAIVPTAGPGTCLSLPSPLGVVGIVASRGSSLLGLSSQLASALAAGNSAIVLASPDRPLPALALAEVLADCSLPPGTVNILTGRPSELGSTLASAPAVHGLDLTGVTDDRVATEMEFEAAGVPTRVVVRPRREPDWTEDQGLERMRAFTRTITVWS